MQSTVEPEFDDPALKEAVCKCWACDCAPTHLKNQIAALLSNRENSKDSFRRMSWMIWPVALAAMLLICVGLFNHFHAKPAFAALPASLTSDLISTHDHCCAEANHQHLNVPKDSDVAITDALHMQLQRPMLVCRPSDDAWSFRGASVCPVGSTASGHLVFAKGDLRLSLFSLPKSLTPQAAEGAEYSSTVHQHCIVGFVKDGALFCLVESGPAGTITVDELKQMESQMQPAVALSRSPQTPRVELAELLQPIGQ